MNTADFNLILMRMIGFMWVTIRLLIPIAIFIISFKKLPGSLWKKGLFATTLLGVFILLSQGIFHMRADIFWIPRRYFR